MPLSYQSLYRLGLFGESDYLSLSPSLSVDGNKLYDHSTGGKHQLHPRAAEAVRHLRNGTIFHKWLFEMADAGLSIGQMSEIILFLNGIGGFNVRRTWAQKADLLIRRFRLRLQGGPTLKLAIRWPLDCRHFCQALWSSTWPLLVWTEIVAGLYAATGIVLFDKAILIGAVFWLSVAFSLGLHELTHVKFIGRPGPVLLQRGLRLAVLHKPLPYHRTVLTSLAGPLAGAICSLIFSLIVSIAADTSNWLWLGGLVASFHLLSWLPSYADGQSLLVAWRIRRSYASRR